MRVSVFLVGLFHVVVSVAMGLVAIADEVLDKRDVPLVILLTHVVWLVTISSVPPFHRQKFGECGKSKETGMSPLLGLVFALWILVLVASLLPGFSFKLSTP